MTQRFEPVHMILGQNDQVNCITTSDKVIQKIEMSAPRVRGLTVYRDVSPLVVLQYLEGDAPWKRLVDDEAWSRLSAAIPEFQKHLLAFKENQSEPLYKKIPIDFPPVLVEGRSQILEDYPRVADLPAMRELTEIKMAALNRRPVNEGQFRPTSLEARWSEDTLRSWPEDMLYEQLDHLDRMISTDHCEDPRWSAWKAQEFREIQLILDENEEAPEERMALGY